MQITNNFDITRHNNATYHWTKDGILHFTTPSDPECKTLDEMYSKLKACTPELRSKVFEEWVAKGLYPVILGTPSHTEAAPRIIDSKVEKPSPEAVLKNGLQSLMNFFSEFQFTPSFRFVNTLSHKFALSTNDAKSYITNYFRLMDNSYTNEIVEKMKSHEFKVLSGYISQYGAPKHNINSRLKIYFGAAGTGKTTLAQTESDNRCVVCNNSMLPADLMEDFRFTDGKAEFAPSILWECMEQGKTIVLDEINLLPFDSLRFLQGVCDGKSEFSYKNRPVKIADGFQIIGTMNLTLGGMNYGLPEPLVDRCADIREFELSAEQLMSAIVG